MNHYDLMGLRAYFLSDWATMTDRLPDGLAPRELKCQKNEQISQKTAQNLGKHSLTKQDFELTVTKQDFEQTEGT